MVLESSGLDTGVGWSYICGFGLGLGFQTQGEVPVERTLVFMDIVSRDGNAGGCRTGSDSCREVGLWIGMRRERATGGHRFDGGREFGLGTHVEVPAERTLIWTSRCFDGPEPAEELLDVVIARITDRGFSGGMVGESGGLLRVDEDIRRGPGGAERWSLRCRRWNRRISSRVLDSSFPVFKCQIGVAGRRNLHRDVSECSELLSDSKTSNRVRRGPPGVC